MKLIKTLNFHHNYKHLGSVDRIEKIISKEIRKKYKRLKKGKDDPLELKFDIGERFWALRKTKRELMIPSSFNSYIQDNFSYLSRTSIWRYMRVRAFMNIYSYPHYKSVGIGCLYKIAVANKNRTLEYYINKKLLPELFDSENESEIKKIRKEIYDVASVYKKPKKIRPKRLPTTEVSNRLDKLIDIVNGISSGMLRAYKRDGVGYKAIRLKSKYLLACTKNIKGKIKAPYGIKIER
jgi:hypothetical protein